MRYFWPTAEDMLGTLPPAGRDELAGLLAVAAAAETAERRWITVPAPVWAELTARALAAGHRPPRT